MQVLTIATPGGLENILNNEVDPPTPGAGEVLVRWKATSLNYHDYLVAAGGIPVADGRVPMSDGAGVIEALGDGVSEWEVGDKVMSLFFPDWLDGDASAANTAAVTGDSVDGFAREFSCEKAVSLTSIPKSYTFAEAATLPCAALTAWRGLVVEGNLKAGDTVLIQGSGGMSVFGLQIAKAAGAYVYATTSSDKKAERLQALGADHVINYKEDEKWGKTIAKLSGGVDHILDVGGPSTLEHSVEAVGFGGKISLIGVLGGRKGEFVLPKMFFKHASMNGIAVGSRAMQQDLVRAIDVAEFKPVIDRSFALTELADAFRHQESGAHFGKIVLEY
ncbi:MAG: NAD(P)-dependent alcohol dehydrogenase [Gammaproteobacteria bacterium]|nr:NAD(P)-dependent alcohol dehydrogenase [Gammaproteobacteria bacterium]